MRNKLLVSFFVAFSGVFIHLSAQDIHFSQFYMSPLNLNPAMTGVMNCNKRAIVNYRNQWAAALGSNAFNTMSASYDQKLAVGQNDYFGVGGTVWGDVAGASRFSTAQARLSFSYSKKISGTNKKSHHLVVGADAGMTQRRIDTGDLRWPSQHDGNGGFDPTRAGGIIANDNITYADLSAGLLWFSNLSTENSFYVGAAMHHLNQANVSFLGQTSSLFTKTTIHGGGEFAMNKKMSLLPGFVLFFQGPHREYNVGSSVRWKMSANTRGGGDQNFQLGLWYRSGVNESGGWHTDAVIASTRFDYKSYGFGFSYDWTLSDFREASPGNGAFEFSLSYLLCGDQSRGVYCPTF